MNNFKQIIENEIIWGNSLEGVKCVKNEKYREWFIRGLNQALLLYEKWQEVIEPNYDVKPSQFDTVTEGYNPDKILIFLPKQPPLRKIKEGE